jgi:hypothetical protein
MSNVAAVAAKTRYPIAIAEREGADTIVLQFKQPIGSIKGFFGNLREAQGKTAGLEGTLQGWRATYAKLPEVSSLYAAHLLDCQTAKHRDRG